VGAIPSVDPEAAPLVLLEYMSLGLPVVATDHGGTPEVIGDAGLLVPPRDPAALAAALATMVDDRALRERCRQAGRDAIAAGLTIEAQRAALADLLAEVAAG
jgi:glycosyltransferase involved in cell wall biosynthesis